MQATELLWGLKSLYGPYQGSEIKHERDNAFHPSEPHQFI